MLFNSPEFVLGFLPIALAGFFLSGRFGGQRWALRWLVAASLFFYGWWNRPVRPAARRLHRRQLRLRPADPAVWRKRGRQPVRAPMAGRGRLHQPGTARLVQIRQLRPAQRRRRGRTTCAGISTIFLPLAVSFFTFQQIMFLVESYREQRPDAGPLAYAGFVAFFPHLIAGPIVRPREIMPQLLDRDMIVPRSNNLAEGLIIFLLGLAKKVVLADTFASFADVGFDAAARGASLNLVEAWYAAAAYALQIYFDFSGYSDMAIGLARMLNIRFPLNFASPYKATNIRDFWRCWHITLSRFLRDHVYIPLGGNRDGEIRRNVNLIVTMLLGGLWHGAAWSFVMWGGLHALYLVIHGQFRRSGPADALCVRACADADRCRRCMGAVPREQPGCGICHAAWHGGIERLRLAANDRARVSTACMDRPAGTFADVSR